MNPVSSLPNTGVSTPVVFFLLFATAFFYAPYWLYRQSPRLASSVTSEHRLILLNATMLVTTYGSKFLSSLLDSVAPSILEDVLLVLFTFTSLVFIVSLWLACRSYAIILASVSSKQYSETLIVLFNVVYLNEWQNSLADS